MISNKSPLAKRQSVAEALVALNCELLPTRLDQSAPINLPNTENEFGFLGGGLPAAWYFAGTTCENVVRFTGDPTIYRVVTTAFRTASGVAFYTSALMEGSRIEIKRSLLRRKPLCLHYDALKLGNPLAHALMFYFDQPSEWPNGSIPVMGKSELLAELDWSEEAFDV